MAVTTNCACDSRNQRGADKSKSSHTTGGKPWLRSSLVECSWAVLAHCRQDSGHKKGPAMIAIAHTVVQFVLHALRRDSSLFFNWLSLVASRFCRNLRDVLKRVGWIGILAGLRLEFLQSLRKGALLLENNAQ